MINLILFALKNLARYKRRTLLTASAVAVGIAVFIIIDGWLLGAKLESDRNIVWYETSSARIMNPDYWKEKDRLPLSIALENPDKITALLDKEGIPWAARTVFSAELVVWQDPFEEDGSMPVRVFGIDPERDDDVFRFRETLMEGRYLEPGDEGVMIGSWLAEDLGAEVGFSIALVTRTRDGFYQTIDAVITGILDCPNPVINRSSVFMDLAAADHYLQMNSSVTEINLSFPENADPDEQAAAVETLLESGGLNPEVMSWREMASAYGALTEAKQAGTGVIMFLLFIIAAVGITNTMLMAVFERIRELGMLRAIGMKDREIRFLFMTEAAGIGFLGAVIGLAIGILGSFYMINIGVDFSWMVREMDIGYRTAGRFYGAWNPLTMGRAFFTGIIICFSVAYFPTRKALKMKITDCLRH